MTTRFKVVSMHFTNKCDLNCPFCYKTKGKETMDRDLMLELPRYLKKITPQVALGGGEPMMEKELLMEFAQECAQQELLCNFTSNGIRMAGLTDHELDLLLENVRMVNLSFDDYKIQRERDIATTFGVARRIRELGYEVGVNVLVNKTMFNGNNMLFMIKNMFNIFNRVFALYPKNFQLGVDVTKHTPLYGALTMLHKHFYVDDLTNKILEEGYDNWKTPCHWAQDIVNIDLDGSVHGCSFDDKVLYTIKEPEDVLGLADLKVEGRMHCPYLVR